jgi:hypothetical protein
MAVERAVTPSTWETPALTVCVMWPNATNRSSARAEMRWISAINAGSSASERVAVWIRFIACSMRRTAIAATPTTVIVTTTMQI